VQRLFPIPFVLWAVVTIAWFVGLNRVSFFVPNTGQRADIDFNRKYDHTAVALRPDVVLLDDAQLETVKPAWIPWCWLCGRNLRDQPLMPAATHRAGPWVYRAAQVDPNFTGWTNQRGIEAALTFAFNLDTRERLLVERGSSVEVRAAQLAERGLLVDDTHRLVRAEFEPASMLSEGCAIVQTAFLIFLSAWSLVFGVVALVRRRQKPVARGPWSAVTVVRCSCC